MWCLPWWRGQKVSAAGIHTSVLSISFLLQPRTRNKTFIARPYTITPNQGDTTPKHGLWNTYRELSSHFIVITWVMQIQEKMINFPTYLKKKWSSSHECHEKARSKQQPMKQSWLPGLCQLAYYLPKHLHMPKHLLCKLSAHLCWRRTLLWWSSRDQLTEVPLSWHLVHSPEKAKPA